MVESQGRMAKYVLRKSGLGQVGCAPVGRGRRTGSKALLVYVSSVVEVLSRKVKRMGKGLTEGANAGCSQGIRGFDERVQ